MSLCRKVCDAGRAAELRCCPPRPCPRQEASGLRVRLFWQPSALTK